MIETILKRFGYVKQGQEMMRGRLIVQHAGKGVPLVDASLETMEQLASAGIPCTMAINGPCVLMLEIRRETPWT